MAEAAIDLKLFHDVKDYLNKANSDSDKSYQKLPPKPGAFTLFNFAAPPKNSYDEVYPGIWLGDAGCAEKPDVLKKMGISHVVNASMGQKFNQTNTTEVFYAPHHISFHGIPAIDMMTFKILPYLRPGADFIEDALQQNGKVYVHCQQGISRSATVVLAFLMLKRDMDLLSAVKLVRGKREINPNDGFLKQLSQLSLELGKQQIDSK